MTSLKPNTAYPVRIALRAERDIAGIYKRINAEHSEAALKWYLGLRGAILSLERSLNRRPLTPENESLRHLLYGGKPHVYRVLFRVGETPKLVRVLHIRHGARRATSRA